jgi:putative FmdB family regulatory protein
MPAYDYQCQRCGAVREHIQSIHQDLPDMLPCLRCGGEAEQVILVAPAISTSGMSNMTQDMAIGKDAEKRWERIGEKKAQRDKVRRESGKCSLKYEDGQFKPHDRPLDFVKTPPPTED